MSQVFWVLAGLFFIISFVLFADGTEYAGGVLDYRPWFLLFAGVVSAKLGNVSSPSGPGY